MAPTTRASHSAYPSVLAQPAFSSLDDAMRVSRAAALRRHTAQCGSVIADELADAAPRLLFCDDFPRAVAAGARAVRDGPFSTDGCAAVWFTPGEACDLLEALDRLVLFVGDSLLRQLQQGLHTVLTGSYTQGGVPKFSFEEAKSCTCDDAFKFECRERTFASYMGPGELICPKWRKGALVGTAMRLNTVEYFKEHENEVRGVMTVGGTDFSGSVIVLGIGLQEQLAAELILRDVYGPTIEHAKTRGDARIICMVLPSPDMALKPDEYKESQGVESVREFNEKIRRFCADRGVETLEMFAPTANASSYDGTHYGLKTNALLAQLFLNTLAHGPGWERASKLFASEYLF
jgi:hypothetical protein